MKALTLRGIDGDLEKRLVSEAKKSGASMNATIMKILCDTFGLTKKKYRTVHHDLDFIAGTWTKEDQIDFDKNTESFSAIDKDIWS